MKICCLFIPLGSHVIINFQSIVLRIIQKASCFFDVESASFLYFGSGRQISAHKEKNNERNKFIPFQFCGVFGAYNNSCLWHSKCYSLQYLCAVKFFLYFVLVVATFLMCKENRLRENLSIKEKSNIKESKKQFAFHIYKFVCLIDFPIIRLLCCRLRYVVENVVYCLIESHSCVKCWKNVPKINEINSIVK